MLGMRYMLYAAAFAALLNASRTSGNTAAGAHGAVVEPAAKSSEHGDSGSGEPLFTVIHYGYTVEPRLEPMPESYMQPQKGPVNYAVPLAPGWVAVPEDQCWCSTWFKDQGSSSEKTFQQVMNWICFAVCIVSLLWYAFNFWKATCGWEEVFIVSNVCECPNKHKSPWIWMCAISLAVFQTPCLQLRRCALAALAQVFFTASLSGTSMTRPSWYVLGGSAGEAPS